MTSIKKLLEAVEEQANSGSHLTMERQRQIWYDYTNNPKRMEAKLREAVLILAKIKPIIEDIADEDWPDPEMVELLASIKRWENE